MGESYSGKWVEFVREHEDAVLEAWHREQDSVGLVRPGTVSEEDLRRQSREVLDRMLATAAMAPEAESWDETDEFLADLARRQASQGFTPSDTARFVFALRQPILDVLQEKLGIDPALAAETRTVTTLCDRLALRTIEAAIASRDEVIRRQQAEILELSTPVVQVWDGILALPLIGTLDSARTQVVMENLLQTIVDTGSSVAIIDITGVPTVDTLVAQHLIKTVTAARLMGATCIISGIRPQIAQTMVHLGIDFEDILTTASLADALAHAFRLLRLRVVGETAS